MDYSYQDSKAGQEYGEFSDSPDGQMQHRLIFDSIKPTLPKNPASVILDAGCGDGWLTAKLFNNYPNTEGFDVSPTLIEAARQKSPNIKFAVADAAGELPYEKNSFDVIIASLLLHNLENQQQAYNNFYNLIKPSGHLLVISVNPYYGYPVGVWKRGITGKLLNKKPQLQLRPYFKSMDAERGGNWSGKNIPLRFSPLPEQINCALSAKFQLLSVQDLRTEAKNNVYDFNYRNSRFPLLLLLDFQKI